MTQNHSMKPDNNHGRIKAMKHSKLARLIAGNDRSSTRPANDKQCQKPDTAHDVDNGIDTPPANIAERTTTANDNGQHAANDDA